MDRVLRQPAANLAVDPAWQPDPHHAVDQDHGSRLSACGSMAALDGNEEKIPALDPIGGRRGGRRDRYLPVHRLTIPVRG